MAGIDLIKDGRRLAEVPVLRRQIDGSVYLKRTLLDALAGSQQGKKDEPVSSSEILLRITSDLFLEKTDISVRFPDKG
jgi:hypothetical protein